jgi:hypothetical protein
MRPLTLFPIMLLFLLILLFSCSDEEKETEIAVSDLPAAVTSAIEDTMPGFKITEAEIEEEDGQMIYEVEGTMTGETYEIETSAEGKVIEIEKAGEDEEDKGEGEEKREDSRE